MVQALKKPHTTMRRQALIHTGIVVPPNYTDTGVVDLPGWKDTTRKIRLFPLSFLASQNLQRLGLTAICLFSAKSFVFFWIQSEWDLLERVPPRPPVGCDLRNSKLVFWANMEPTHAFIEEIFGPLREKYGNWVIFKDLFFNLVFFRMGMIGPCF